MATSPMKRGSAAASIVSPAKSVHAASSAHSQTRSSNSVTLSTPDLPSLDDTRGHDPSVASVGEVEMGTPPLELGEDGGMPSLSTKPPFSTKQAGLARAIGEEGEPQEATVFDRSANQIPTPVEIAGQDADAYRMHKFSLYETSARYYLVGADISDSRFRVMKIDRTAPPGQLHVVEDEIVYTKQEMNQLLNTIDDGNRSVGGMKLKTNAWGLLGFIRFTEAYYMLVITKKQQVATVGGHYIYQVDGTELVPLTTGPSSKYQNNRNPEESRFLSILNNLDLNRSFYFSYSYNVTRTLQHNVIRRRELLSQKQLPSSDLDFNDMFVWNQHLLEPALESLKKPYDWCLPIVHGFVDQSTLSVFGRNIYITLLARRSRFFAGARFLKRGANDLGFVANDVETEQIVADMLVTSFNTPRLKHLKNPSYTSFVQHRGSIPLYWTQDNSGVSPKPAIDLNMVDPFYTAAALHFNNLFHRYSAPIYVLNLVKARERTPRESKLLVEYQAAIQFLNQSLPRDKKIRYRAYDMSRAAKTHGHDVIAHLESIADEVLKTTGFFSNDGEPDRGLSVQNGVVRSNCIDCLDRTNAAQFVIGKRALAYQLQALGVITDASLNFDSDASNLFAHMFNDQGDTLASQYGGSHLVNTTDSYRKINNWQSHSRDMLESFKRYYHNSFLDAQRQEAYNLFLGNYIYAQGQPMLWELPNDYYLHHTNPGDYQSHTRGDRYINWYTPEYLEPFKLPPVPEVTSNMETIIRADWWHEYYRPQILSSFLRIFAYRMNSTVRYLPRPSSRSSRFDQSPFSVRAKQDGHEVSDVSSVTTAGNDESRSRPPSKGNPIQGKISGGTDSSNAVLANVNPLNATSAPQNVNKRIISLQKWLHTQTSDDVQNGRHQPLSRRVDPEERFRAEQRPSQQPLSSTAFKPSDKALKNQWTLAQFHANSLHPSVDAKEEAEYQRYLAAAEGVTSRPTHGFNNKNQQASSRRTARSRSRSSTRKVSGNKPSRSGAATPDPSAAEYASYVDVPRALGDTEVPLSSSSSRPVPLSRANSAAAVSTLNSLAATSTAWLQSAMQNDPLSVRSADAEHKRYQAYGKWIRGKSLFKQSMVDPEFRGEAAGRTLNGVGLGTAA